MAVPILSAWGGFSVDAPARRNSVSFVTAQGDEH
jgi:hypothetical protein